MVENYNRFNSCPKVQNRELVARPKPSMDDNLHSLPRQLSELGYEAAASKETAGIAHSWSDGVDKRGRQ